MKLHEVLSIMVPEAEEVLDVVDAATADRFLSRVEKLGPAKAHPAVSAKFNALQAKVKDGETQYKDAAMRLAGWLTDNPLSNVKNPASLSMYHRNAG